MESEGIISDSFILISSIDKIARNLELSGNWIPDSLCAATKTISDWASVHTHKKNGCGGVISVSDGERLYLTDL